MKTLTTRTNVNSSSIEVVRNLLITSPPRLINTSTP